MSVSFFCSAVHLSYKRNSSIWTPTILLLKSTQRYFGPKGTRFLLCTSYIEFAIFHVQLENLRGEKPLVTQNFSSCGFRTHLPKWEEKGTGMRIATSQFVLCTYIRCTFLKHGLCWFQKTGTSYCWAAYSVLSYLFAPQNSTSQMTVFRLLCDAASSDTQGLWIRKTETLPSPFSCTPTKACSIVSGI